MMQRLLYVLSWAAVVLIFLLAFVALAGWLFMLDGSIPRPPA